MKGSAGKTRTQMHALGCKVNYADTLALLERLSAGEAPPAALVGTCCVTAEAEKQSRKQVRRAARQAGPEGMVCVSGCAARLDPAGFKALAENVVVINEAPAVGKTGPGTDNPAFPGREADGPGAAAGKERVRKDRNAATDLDEAARRQEGRIRSFIKVQDGCGNGCAYCVIPQARGGPRSIDAAEVQAKARATVAAGIPELVLTGINLGAYGDKDMKLPDLVRSIAGTEGLRRLRLSSIEMEDVSQELIEAMVAGGAVVGRHLHIPLQSGDDGILAAMGRRYQSGSFQNGAERLREALPGLNLTTDVIVGFPGEDDQAFGNTLSLVESVGFSKVHVFPYSPRKGTRAFTLGDPVPRALKKERSRRLRKLSQRLGDNHRRRKLGQVSEVLLESPRTSGFCEGYSSDYARFRVKTGDGNRMAPVLGLDLGEGVVSGEVVADE